MTRLRSAAFTLAVLLIAAAAAFGIAQTVQADNHPSCTADSVPVPADSRLDPTAHHGGSGAIHTTITSWTFSPRTCTWMR